MNIGVAFSLMPPEIYIVASAASVFRRIKRMFGW